MPAYIVNIDSTNTGATLLDGIDGMVIFAQDATDATRAARSAYGGDSDLLWSSVTPIAPTESNDYEGWRLKITISGAAAQTVPEISVTATGASGDDMDDIATLAVTALNNTSDIAGAAYATASNTLTIAAISDGIGDATVTVEFLPPLDSTKFLDPNISFSNYVATITHKGIAGATLITTLWGIVAPDVIVKYKQA